MLTERGRRQPIKDPGFIPYCAPSRSLARAVFPPPITLLPLMALVDALETRLATARTTASQLLAAAVAELTTA